VTRASSIVAFAAVSVLALAASACTEKASYWTPEGDDATAAGSWTVHGAPATADTCAAAGVDEVALVFVHDGVEVDVGTFTFPCAQGAFDSRPVAVLAAGSYDVHWLFTAVDGGATSFSTTPSTIVAAPGGHVDLAVGDYP
jgi:hypothetical protein